MKETTEGMLIASTCLTFSLIWFMSKEGALPPRALAEIMDHAEMFLAQLSPDLMSEGGRAAARQMMEGFVAAFPSPDSEP